MNTFNVLSRDLNVFAPYFLEASAGTGKTFAIEHLVVRLLIEGNSPLGIEQILVVTFTRAATRELKKRIRENLCRAKEQLVEGVRGADYLEAICEKGEQAVKDAVQKIDAGLINFDSAQIYTLHGFCHRALNEFAFEAGIGFEVSNPEEQQHRVLLTQLIKSHLKRSLKGTEYSPLQMKILLNKYQGDHRKMVGALIDLVTSNKQIHPAPPFHKLLETFVNQISILQAVEKTKFKSDIEALRPLYKKMDEKETAHQIELFGEILESKQCTFQQFERLFKGVFFLEKMGPEHRKVRAKEPAQPLHYPGLVDQLRCAVLPLLDQGKDSTTILLRLAHDLKENAQELLEKTGKFSPDELLIKMRQAAHLPDFAEGMRQRYRAAIIDEFQDTDPVQWDIFQTLFLSKMEAICLVGDPKQSIYAFRNADVYTYLNAAKAMGTSSKRDLDTNYRSTASLVQALNLLFSKPHGHWMGLPRTAEALEVKPVRSADETEDTEVPLQFFIAAGKKGREKRFPTCDILEKQIFPFLASEIDILHREKGVEYHDVAILIKDRFMAKEVVDYLKLRGIPASSKQGALITDSVAYFALKEILAAVCSPSNLSKVKAALGGPLIAWGQNQLNKGLADPSLLQAKAQMQRLNHILFEKGFPLFFQTVLHSRWGDSPMTLLEELLGRGDLSLYLDLRKLSELCLEEAMSRDLRGEGFLRFLTEMAMEAHRDDTRLRTVAHEEKGSVAVMTIHVSKGLEFDTVFALGIAARHKPSDMMAIYQDGCSLIRPYHSEDPDCRRSIEELDAEKMRQLYVALTRAKKRLYVPLVIDEEQKPIQEGEASPMELFFARMGTTPSSHEELYAHAQRLDLSRAKTILPPLKYRILEEMGDVSYGKTVQDPILETPKAVILPRYDEQLLSFTSLAKKETFLEPAPPASSLLSSHSFPLGSQTGHLLHHLFEKIFKLRLHHPLDEHALSELIRQEIASTPLEGWIPILHPWIVALLKKNLVQFALSDVPGHQLQQEMEFYFPVSKGIMKGFCDLLLEFKGKYYLLDWKSNYLGPSDADYTQEKMEQVMHGHDYFLQASIYASALKRFVKLFDNRPFSESFGGAIYYFVRGKAFYHFIPEPYGE